MRDNRERTLAEALGARHRRVMPRKPRIGEPGMTFHVWANGVAKSYIFRDEIDRDVLLRLLREEAELSRWTCLSYAVLSSHYHLLLRLNEPTLSTGFQRLHRRYAQHHNRRYEVRGHCFDQRFQASSVDTAGDEIAIARYIARNPTKAGLCSRPEDWQWSSYGAVVGLYPADPIVDTDAALAVVGGSRRRYRAAVEVKDARLTSR